MSDLAQSFLERWTEENVTPVTPAERAAEAERLATACKEEAAQEGFTDAELDEACAQSSDDEQTELAAYMLAALETASAVDEDEPGDEDDED